jgi:hypothetical protein
MHIYSCEKYMYTRCSVSYDLPRSLENEILKWLWRWWKKNNPHETLGEVKNRGEDLWIKNRGACGKSILSSLNKTVHLGGASKTPAFRCRRRRPGRCCWPSMRRHGRPPPRSQGCQMAPRAARPGSRIRGTTAAQIHIRCSSWSACAGVVQQRQLEAAAGKQSVRTREAGRTDHLPPSCWAAASRLASKDWRRAAAAAG